MPLLNAAYIGLADGLASTSVDHSVDMATLQNGLAQAQHPRELTISASKEKTFGDAWGIMANNCPLNTMFNADGVIIDSVTWTRADEVSDRQMVAHSDYANSSGYVLPNGTKFLMTTQNMLWLGYTETFAFTLKHTSDISSSSLVKQGARITTPFAVTPAVVGTPLSNPTVQQLWTAGAPYVAYYSASNPMDFCEHLVVTSVGKRQSSNDWHTVEVQLSRRVPVSTASCAGDLGTLTGTSPLREKLQLWGTVNLWNPIGGNPAGVDDNGYMPTHDGMPAFYRATITVSLTSGGSPTLSESIEFYPDVTKEDASYMVIS